MTRLPKNRKQKGQILLAILIALAVFAILTHALFTLMASSYDLISYNKARITARHLGQEKIETIRNLPYDEVGTVGGAPEGIIEPTEAIVRNGLNYTIKTDIAYHDDPFNGTGPGYDTDYKRVRVEVSWEGIAASRKNPLVLITDITANYTTSVSGGTLVILVFDANGNPVSQADVTIVADSIDPPISISTKTNTSGQVTRSGLTPCIACYKITVTKDDMSTDRTYSDTEVTNPTKPDASIFQDSLTQISFAIDTLGTINIASFNSRDNGFTPAGGVPFRIHGNKIIGTDAYAQPVYKYDENLTTDGAGNLAINDAEWDIYHVTMPDPTSYDISGTDPSLPLYLTPGGSVDFSFATEPHTDHSFLVTAKDSGLDKIASASARIYDDLGFEETKSTGQDTDPDFGQALFSGLEEKTYHFTATASGFLDYSSDYDVSGYTVTDIVMQPE